MSQAQRVAYVMAAVIFGLGILIADFVAKDAIVEAPWTIPIIIFLFIGWTDIAGFVSASKFSSGTIFSEGPINIKFHFYPAPIRLIKDGFGMVWAVLEAGGWTFYKSWVTSKNFGVSGAISQLIFIPARMLECRSGMFPIIRARLYRMPPDSLAAFFQKKRFDEFVKNIPGFSFDRTEFYIGFASTTMHGDEEHKRNRTDIGTFKRMMEADRTQYETQDKKLKIEFNKLVETHKKIASNGKEQVVVIKRAEEKS